VLAQCLDDVSAVGDERAEEAEDVADASGVEARGHGPIGIELDGFGRGGGGVGHGAALRHKTRTWARTFS